MNSLDSLVEGLLGKTVSLQRADSLLPIDGFEPTARFQLSPEQCSPSYLAFEQTRGEKRGRTVLVARHLIVNCEPLGGAQDVEWRVLLRAPYTVEEAPSGWRMHVGSASSASS